MYMQKAVMLAMAFAKLSCLSAASEALLPLPRGQYGTVLSTTKLVDLFRIDPFASHKQPRAVMISMFYPVLNSKCSNPIPTSYMPPTTAASHDALYGAYGIPNATFESLRLQVCSGLHWSDSDIPRPPIVLFSPGLGNSRLLYNSIAQSVASNGYIVVSIDHPYDASIVEFPDGSVIMAANISTADQIELALVTRTDDVSFVLNELSKPVVSRGLFPSMSRGLNVREVGIFGHSLGGATSIAAMVNDSRISGGVNLDGTFFGPAISEGTEQPFLIIGHQGKDRSNDCSWRAMWPRLKGWRLEIGVNGTQHASWTDLPILVDVLGLRSALPPAVIQVLGGISGARISEITRMYLGAFFNKALVGDTSLLLQRPSSSYPEVIFVDAHGVADK